MEIFLGIIGLILISVAVWIKREKKQNVLFILGGGFLLVYSLMIDDLIFVALQIVFILSASFEIFKKREK